MKSKFLVMSLGVLSIFLMSLFSVPVVAAPTHAESQSALPTEIKLCGVFPISQRPDAGPDRRDGFLMAIDEINAQTGTDRILPAGVSLTGLVKDDDNNAEGGTAAANSCVSDGAHLVIGSSGSTVSLAMQAVLNPLKIIQISYASSSPTLSDRTAYPYFMRNLASDADQGLAVADLIEDMGLDTGATINTDDSYGTGLITHFKANFAGTLASEQTFTPGATDVSSEVQAIVDANPQFVLLHAIDNDAKTVFKKAFELGAAGGSSTIVWVITDGSSTTATFAGDTEVKEAMQNVVGTNPAEAGASNYDDFLTAWDAVATCGTQDPCGNSRTSTAPNSYAPFAYDSVFVAAEGLADADDVSDPDALLASLYAVEFTGASGPIKFNSIGEINGRFDYVQLADDAYTSFGSWEGTATYTEDSITVAGGQIAKFDGSGLVAPSAFGFELLVGIFALGTFVAIRKRK